jgi:hypothetical protein
MLSYIRATSSSGAKAGQRQRGGALVGVGFADEAAEAGTGGKGVVPVAAAMAAPDMVAHAGQHEEQGGISTISCNIDVRNTSSFNLYV